MSPPFNRLDGYNIFDDKSEVKRFVESLIQDKDPDVTIESMRKMDYSYLFNLSQRGKTIEVELPRAGSGEKEKSTKPSSKGSQTPSSGVNPLAF